MSILSRLARPLAARDPGRARLAVATAVAAAVLASAVLALWAINLLHADKALLTMAVIMSAMAGRIPHDRTAQGRAITTALQLPMALAAVSLAVFLSSWRPAVIVVFVVLTGISTWVRRFGPRASGLGALAFIGYFFALFMQPKLDDLPTFLAIVVCAMVPQLVVRLLLLLKRPRRELATLLAELRVASATALHAASTSEHPRALHNKLARTDDIGRAISAWQQRYRTELQVACDEQTLSERVLDARVDTEEVCYELARRPAAAKKQTEPEVARALAGLNTILNEHARPDEIPDAVVGAHRIVDGANPKHRSSVSVYLIARATLAHARVRDIDLTHGLPAPTKTPAPAPVVHTPADAVADGKPRWTAWKDWAPTSRLAVQAMIAASIATAAGEAISASRWYWAVMTAFVIFTGVTTRSGILTKAYRRIVGTLVGIFIGAGAVALADSNSAVLIAICVIGVFGMLYWGPVNYVYSAFYMTFMLVAVYAMLGVLDSGLLELRLIETITGALIGVLSAYLILSASSRPVIIGVIDRYFDALDAVLKAGLREGSSEESADVLGAIHALDAAHANAEQTVATMSTAFLIGRHDLEVSVVHLMHISTRSADRFAQSALGMSDKDAATTEALRAAIGDVRAAATRARGTLEGARPDADAAYEASATLSRVDEAPFDPRSREDAMLLALARIDWAMRRIIDVVEPDSSRRARSVKRASPPV